MKKIICLLCFLANCITALAQQAGSFNGVNTNLGNLQKLSTAKSRSISPENFSGKKGQGGMAELADSAHQHKAIAAHQARELGQGWKLNPNIIIKSGETFTLADIDSSGAIQHIWMTPNQSWRLAVLRIYWDGEKTPSVECPVGHFFGMGLDKFAQLNSLPVVVNPNSGFNCYWTMPFRRHCKITIENLNPNDLNIYYQIDYVLTKVDADDAYFHAQFRQTAPGDTSALYTIIDNVEGSGQYVGTYMTWKQKWGSWGEGEIKFYMDGDTRFPTINGTGTEDYFLGAYGWDVGGKTTGYSTAYAGLHQIIEPGTNDKPGYKSYGMYRWHIKDPIRFSKSLKVTIQELGWKVAGQTYTATHSEVSSVAFWYQAEPHAAFPVLPAKEELKMK